LSVQLSIVIISHYLFIGQKKTNKEQSRLFQMFF